MNLKEQIKAIEKRLDDFNAENGTEDKLCIFCGSGRYGNKGIVHEPDCLILTMRGIISQLDHIDVKKIAQEVIDENKQLHMSPLVFGTLVARKCIDE